MDACYSGLAEADLPNNRPAPLPQPRPQQITSELWGQSAGITYKPLPIIATQPRIRDNAFVLQQSLFADIERGNGVHIISASSGYDVAVEATQLDGKVIGHGLFTYALLTAAKELTTNQPQNPTVSALREHTEHILRTLTQGKQIPDIRSENYAGDFRIW